MTDETSASSTGDDATEPRGTGIPLGRTLLWLGIAGASATVTYFVLRAVLRPQPGVSDETADRIQALIDEANRLIKTLDEKKLT